MCRFALAVTFLLGLSLSAVAQPVMGTAAPNFTLNNVNGSGPVTLSNFLGEVVLLNFFGATCGDCIEDAPLTEAIYQQFQTNPEFNIIGIDVWNLPASYVNLSFRAQTGITYSLLSHGRTTGYAYNMEVNPSPSPTDNEHRGYVIVDRQGIMRHYWIYNPFGVTQQQEIIAALQAQFDPCAGVQELDAPEQVVLVRLTEDTAKLCWNSVECATGFQIFRSLTGDWSDDTWIGETASEAFEVSITNFENAVYHVVAVRE